MNDLKRTMALTEELVAEAARTVPDVPHGHYFVVGDNLQQSDDSRVWHEPFVAATCISGVALPRRALSGGRLEQGPPPRTMHP